MLSVRRAIGQKANLMLIGLGNDVPMILRDLHKMIDDRMFVKLPHHDGVGGVRRCHVAGAIEARDRLFFCFAQFQ